jgi:hypothetical protein
MSSKLGARGAGSLGVSVAVSAAVEVIAAIAAWSATPFSCGAVSFVILKNLGVFVLSEIIQSERWSVRLLGIRRHATTSSVAGP